MSRLPEPDFRISMDPRPPDPEVWDLPGRSVGVLVVGVVVLVVGLVVVVAVPMLIIGNSLRIVNICK